ncbi:hypothetical protein SGLAM104S_06201 [Streptomyces glaucescens]
MTTARHPAVERADLLIDLGRYDEARQLLAERLAEDPEDIRAWVKLARSHLAGDEQDGATALEATQRALTLDSSDVGAIVMHAHALRAAGRFLETEDVLREAIRLPRPPGTGTPSRCSPTGCGASGPSAPGGPTAVKAGPRTTSPPCGSRPNSPRRPSGWPRRRCTPTRSPG